MALHGWIGPRKEGGRYFNGYWGEEYTVTEIGPSGPGQMMTVEWRDGHQTTHCTPWDQRRDHVIQEPPA
jgi:hypothetical protein